MRSRGAVRSYSLIPRLGGFTLLDAFLVFCRPVFGDSRTGRGAGVLFASPSAALTESLRRHVFSWRVIRTSGWLGGAREMPRSPQLDLNGLKKIICTCPNFTLVFLLLLLNIVSSIVLYIYIYQTWCPFVRCRRVY